ncbi:hypothetical protein PLESTB_001088200 [Pleodorina starrii]|uniref:Uncharacterized protein n=1 Tax=Pleodorina starrii TaxID=330485 RepID=A0A9W6BQY0_9CHLO|nr:hypothetical protein PLESTM_000698100 [Pleodorina starrii]GLC56285.1 hypothetical protein PLESTB_001088200 [Pleodorina starrii]GLC69629.1 hypothetical protein PLESTF_000856600 [Pleodorina starrii]
MRARSTAYCKRNSATHCNVPLNRRTQRIYWRCGQSPVPASRLVSASLPSESSAAGLLLEVDGAVMDIHLDGHRVAFNAAFHSIGMDCVQWSPPVYNDLLGCSDGTGEGLITAYYTTVGWPMMVATAERPAFVRKVHELKDRELGKLLARDGVPLRQDVKQVISDAVSGGAAVSLLCGTQCTLPEELGASCRRLLGQDLGGAVRLFTFALAPPEPDSGGDDAPTPMLSQMLSAAAGDLKQRAAMQLICRWKDQNQEGEAHGKDKGKEGGGGGGSQGGQRLGLGLDPSLMAAGGAQQRISPEFVGALVATTGTPAANTIAVAASNSALQAAAGAGLYPVAVPRKFATQGTFPAARVKFDGFGPGLATWSRLKALLANGNGSGSGKQ